MTLAIVTATTDPRRAEACIQSWEDQALEHRQIIIIVNGREWTPAHNDTKLQATWTGSKEYLGTVAAFKLGVNFCLQLTDPPDIIACLHDDFRIDESRWDEKVIRHFERHPNCGLLGFGGAVGLGSTDLYHSPYDPMQLARIGFRSNLEDAESHGLRSLLPERAACLDGFSQVGRREFWDGAQYLSGKEIDHDYGVRRPWDVLDSLGVKHHFYDGMLGCLAKRYGWETWYLPLRGKHFGGQTAVGDQGYGDWAKAQTPGGDHDFWTEAHKAGYEEFRDILPIRL